MWFHIPDVLVCNPRDYTRDSIDKELKVIVQCHVAGQGETSVQTQHLGLHFWLYKYWTLSPTFRTEVKVKTTKEHRRRLLGNLSPLNHLRWKYPPWFINTSAFHVKKLSFLLIWLGAYQNDQLVCAAEIFQFWHMSGHRLLRSSWWVHVKFWAQRRSRHSASLFN